MDFAKNVTRIWAAALLLLYVSGCAQKAKAEIELEYLCQHMNILRAKAGAATQPKCASWMAGTRRVDGAKLWKQRKRCLEQSASLKELEQCRFEHHPQWSQPAPPRPVAGPAAEMICRHLRGLKPIKSPDPIYDASCIRRMHSLSEYDGSRRWPIRAKCMLSSATRSQAYKCNKAHGLFDASASNY